MIGRFQFKSNIHRGDRLNPTVTGENGHVIYCRSIFAYMWL